MKKVVSIPNDGTYTTTYIGSLYEKQETPSGDKTVNHIYLGSAKVASRESTGTTLYTHGDHLGSSSVITDQTGTVIQHIEYEPFGKVILDERTGADGTEYKFTGKELDSNELYYYGARYYDAEICRFITADSIVPESKDPQSFNRYTYCRNNPVKYIDPTGHSFKKHIGTIVGAIVGIVATILFGPAVGFKAFSITKSIIDGGNAIQKGASPGKVIAAVGVNIALNCVVPGGNVDTGHVIGDTIFHALRGGMISAMTAHAMGTDVQDAVESGAMFAGIGAFLNGAFGGQGGENRENRKTDYQTAATENNPNLESGSLQDRFVSMYDEQRAVSLSVNQTIIQNSVPLWQNYAASEQYFDWSIFGDRFFREFTGIGGKGATGIGLFIAAGRNKGAIHFSKMVLTQIAGPSVAKVWGPRLIPYIGCGLLIVHTGNSVRIAYNAAWQDVSSP